MNLKTNIYFFFEKIWGFGSTVLWKLKKRLFQLLFKTYLLNGTYPSFSSGKLIIFKCGFSLLLTCGFLLQKHWMKLSELNVCKLEKRRYLPQHKRKFLRRIKIFEYLYICNLMVKPLTLDCIETSFRKSVCGKGLIP